jgi:pyruvate dehydrogenase E2 component (dihydrolipoamide acetyltransferase)
MIEIAMPRLSDSMEEGTVLQWLKADGDEIERGDELAEIETDKATMTFEADAGGVLHIVAREGDTLPVGAVIAHLLAAGEEVPAGTPAPAAADPPEAAGGDGSSSPSAPAAVPAPTPEPAPEPVAVAAAPAAEPGARVKASPLARRVAREAGVELTAIAGSGPGGRIVRADVEAAAKAPAAPAAPAAAPGAAPSGNGGSKGETQTVRPTRTQQLIARRMSESKATIPDFQVRTEVDVTELVALRAQLRESRGSTPSVNDFVVKACALALREHPRVNGAYVDGAFSLHGRVNVGIAVAGEGTLVVPTIFDADLKPVTQIGAEARELAAKVRDQTITPPELSGGTFTVSNLGMFGVTSFTAVINPGQSAILAVGAAVARAVRQDGEWVERRLMDICLTCDHRILYGADAAVFVKDVRERLEKPLGLLS